MDSVYEQLVAEFPQAAYNIDKSRGFQLIGIRSAFVTERLTEVFGMLGVGWRFAHGPFDVFGKEVVVEVILQYAVEDGGLYPYYWDQEAEAFRPDEAGNKMWSEPVPGYGGNQLGSGGVPMSDAKKSAISNALSKVASRLGVGIDAYKGKLEIDGNQVVVKGEGDTHDDTAKVLKALLGHALRQSPELYDELAKTNKTAAAHRVLVVKHIVGSIKKAKLVEFVGEHISQLVGDDDASSVDDLTAAQLVALNDIVKSIATEDITWKDALAITGELDAGWGTTGSWEKALAAYKAAASPEEESVEDDDS